MRDSDDCVTRQLAAANECLRGDASAPKRTTSRFDADRETCRFPGGITLSTNRALRSGDGFIRFTNGRTVCLEQTTHNRERFVVTITTPRGTASVTVDPDRIRATCADGTTFEGDLTEVLSCNRHWQPPGLVVTEHVGSRVEIGEHQLDTTYVCAYR